MPDDRYMRFFAPPLVLFFALHLGVVTDSNGSLESVLCSLGVRQDTSYVVAALLGILGVWTAGFVLFSITLATVYLFSDWWIQFELWLTRKSVHDRRGATLTRLRMKLLMPWKASDFDHAYHFKSFWTKDCRKLIEREHHPGGGVAQRVPFGFEYDSEFAGYFVEEKMPEYVRTKLTRNWQFFYTDLSAALSVFLSWVIACLAGIHPSGLWRGASALIFLFFVLNGRRAWCEAWQLEHYYCLFQWTPAPGASETSNSG